MNEEKFNPRFLRMQVEREVNEEKATPDTGLKKAEGETVGEAADRLIYSSFKHPNEPDPFSCFELGANWQLTQSKAEIERLKEEIEQLKSELADEEDKVTDYAVDYARLKEENAALKEQVELLKYNVG